MYYLRLEKAKELQDARKFTSIADILGLTPRYLSLIFKGEKCKKILALALINIKEKTPMNSIEIEERLNYYFYQK